MGDGDNRASPGDQVEMMAGRVPTSAYDAVFAPRSVAVVGASIDENKPGGRCLRFLQKFGYAGEIYPVNPNAREILGLISYPELSSIPHEIDLVVILVPAGSVLEQIEAAATVGAKAVLVCSSGFAESGDEGERRQDQLIAAAARRDILVIGPNSLGLLCVPNGLAATFNSGLEGREDLKTGDAVLISQSGAFGAAVFELAQSSGIGMHCYVSTGNEAVATFNDFLSYFTESSSNTRVIFGYLEGLSDGRRFVELATAARRRGQYVIILKVGMSSSGSRAASSHTGAITGQADVYDAAFRRAGVAAVSDPQDMLDLYLALETPGYSFGRRVGIVTMSGGAGVLISDWCDRFGLETPSLSADSRIQLRSLLAGFAQPDNPVDFGAVHANTATIIECLRIVALDDSVDVVILFIGLSPHLAGELDESIAGVREESGKHIVVAWLGGTGRSFASLRAHKLPAYSNPVSAVRVVSCMADLADWSPPSPSRLSPSASTAGAAAAVMRSGGRYINEYDAKTLLRENGFRCVDEVVASSAEEAIAGFDSLKIESAAIKALDNDLIHKTEADAVVLGVDREGVAHAYREVTDSSSGYLGRTIQHVLVQEMAADGVDLLLGAVRDAQFGPVITLGLGGIYAELADDYATELAPIDKRAAYGMIRRLRMSAVLWGARSVRAYDVGALADLLVRFSEFVMDTPLPWEEIDINPVRLYEEGRGYLALDASMTLLDRRA